MFRIPGKIPIEINWFFFFIAVLIGFIFSQTLLGTFLWVIIIFVSVIFHEFGHALAAYYFGKSPKISLVALGGVTSYDVKNLSFFKQFLIVLCGPLFGFSLFLAAYLLLKFNLFDNSFVLSFIYGLKMVNFYWTIINLLPVLPLDGGQLVRVALEGFFGIKGFRISLFIGMLAAFGISLFFIIQGRFLIGAIFFLFAFQSFDMYRRSKQITVADRNENLAEEMQKGEVALEKGEYEEAKEHFRAILNRSKSGIIHSSAAHMLGLILYQEGDKKKAYELLVSIQDELTDQSCVILHKLAFEEKNYQLAAKLSAKAYQIKPAAEIALINAKAFAELNQPKSSGGWLHTAVKEADLDLEKQLEDPAFDKVKNREEFQHFIKK